MARLLGRSPPRFGCWCDSTLMALGPAHVQRRAAVQRGRLGLLRRGRPPLLLGARAWREARWCVNAINTCSARTLLSVCVVSTCFLLWQGRTQIVDKDQPEDIPKGAFDCGDGYFDPSVRAVMAYDGSAVIRSPGENSAACQGAFIRGSITKSAQHSSVARACVCVCVRVYVCVCVGVCDVCVCVSLAILTLQTRPRWRGLCVRAGWGSKSPRALLLHEGQPGIGLAGWPCHWRLLMLLCVHSPFLTSYGHWALQDKTRMRHPTAALPSCADTATAC